MRLRGMGFLRPARAAGESLEVYPQEPLHDRHFRPARAGCPPPRMGARLFLGLKTPGCISAPLQGENPIPVSLNEGRGFSRGLPDYFLKVHI